MSPPVVIGGCARSGTTLLLELLAQIEGIYAFDNETHLLAADEPEVDALVAQVPTGAKRWVEKTPRNVLYIEEILAAIPDARIVIVVRDGRDVCTSLRVPGWYWVTPRRWVRDVKAGLEWEHHPQVLTVRYERLVASTGSELDRLEDFVSTKIPRSISVHANAVGRWKRDYGMHNEAVDAFYENSEALDLLGALGYEVEVSV